MNMSDLILILIFQILESIKIFILKKENPHLDFEMGFFVRIDSLQFTAFQALVSESFLLLAGNYSVHSQLPPAPQASGEDCLGSQ